MKTVYPSLVLAGLLVFLTGCAQVTEISKTIWGTSTRALEHARTDALRKTYQCPLKECFDAVLTLDRSKKYGTPQTKPFFNVFVKDPNQRHLIVMGILGNVNTTEVGIFFDRVGEGTVRLEISSLSSSAKRRVADAVFDELDKRFSEVN